MKLDYTYNYMPDCPSIPNAHCFGWYKYDLSGKTVKRNWKNFHFHLKSALFHDIWGILRPCAWTESMEGWTTCGSWAAWKEDMMEYLHVKFTPWFRNRYYLKENFINESDSKLLSDSPTSASIRTCDGCSTYYNLKFSGFNVELVKEVLIHIPTGEQRNAFITSLTIEDEDEKDYKTEYQTILRGRCRTKKQCQEFFDKIIAATPDLCWCGGDSHDEI